jgi:hypothetical protein
MLRLVWMLKLVYSFRILAMEVMPDHIHLLLNCKPQFRISDMVKIMKGNTARWLFLKYPELKQSLWGGRLWNPSCCAVTVSGRSRGTGDALYQQPKGTCVTKGNEVQGMKVASGYGVEIRKQNICFRKTMDICRRAVMYLPEALDTAWEELSPIENARRRFNAAEALGACEGLGTDTGAET